MFDQNSEVLTHISGHECSGAGYSSLPMVALNLEEQLKGFPGQRGRQCDGRVAVQPPRCRLVSWHQYYIWRQIPAESPLALILHPVLTLYLALITLNDMMHGTWLGMPEMSEDTEAGSTCGGSWKDTMPQKRQRLDFVLQSSPHYPSGAAEERCKSHERSGELDLNSCGIQHQQQQPQEAETRKHHLRAVHVLFLGPREELCTLTLLQELKLLLSGYPIVLHIHFIGPEVPCTFHGQEVTLPSAFPPSSLCRPTNKEDSQSLPCNIHEPVTLMSSACDMTRLHAEVPISPEAEGQPPSSLLSTEVENREDDPWGCWMKDVLGPSGCTSRKQCGKSQSTRETEDLQLVPSSSSWIRSCDGEQRSIEQEAGAFGGHQRWGWLSADEGQMHVSFWSGCLHEVYGSIRVRYPLTVDNTMLFAPNAGLAAYTSWIPTLRAIFEKTNRDSLATVGLHELSGICSVFTDYSREALHQAQSVAVHCGATSAVPLLVNPFRQPLKISTHGTALPSASNGFMLFIPPYCTP
ncbi:hypothetical protein CEUSTIGMA_g7519.t1 [Chlamydomonas eustigma]|uniref:Uncharacterized protein n=1 Tax=Chlamydomonas eustigma TaxID=1157962 RepID=A0A250XAG2_9CHLO|nr:hypothetical protein CEUSTIGMA_g7519.t1 [Chlamydomonas eustigma]|eukprot:GAX80081.1 hypothetical protein CEUSTIGMA_g7519.t1 [Chlamydomonas eustigma]